MKAFLEQLLNFLPYAISLILTGSILIFIYNYGLQYDQLVGLIEVLIWPGIVLSGLIFFRKVFTYLFFSMEEFNFFGNKGSLKNITEVIEERVQRRFEAEKIEQERSNEILQIETELEKARHSKDSSDKKSEENLILARDIFAKYRKISVENETLTKELASLKKEKDEREARMIAARERMRRRHNSHHMYRHSIHEEGEDVEVECRCPEPTCRKCLMIGCKVSDCTTHSNAAKEEAGRRL